MKQEIRERVESIQKGEAPEGYKETKVGIIPVEWKITTFEDIAEKKVKWSITGGPFGSNLKASEYTTDGIRIIQLQNIGDGVFNDDYKIYTTEEKANELLSCNIFPNEIILSKMGDPVARACFVPNIGMRFLMSSDGIRLVVDESRFSKKFIHDYINSIYFRKRAFDASIGSTRLRIGLQDLKKLLVIAPPLPEQQKIANILSTWNNAIELKEKLITEKKEFKRGVMQKLLTGEMRFPEFTDEWEEKKIGIICEIKKGIQINKTELSIKGKYGVLNGGISPSGYTTEWNTKENTITISEGGNSCGFVNYNKDKFWCGGHCYALTNVKINNLLLYYILKYEEKKIMQLRVGSGLPNIQKKDLINFILLIPKNVDEQEKIARILHLISIEIMTLIKELNQLKEQKIGLMQLLFTGIVRVEVD